MKQMIVFGLLMATVIFSGSAFAQDMQTSTYIPPLINFRSMLNFGDIFTAITTSIAPLVAAVIGLGLAIWDTLFIARLIERAAR